MSMTPPLMIKIGYADFPVRMVEAVNADDDNGENSWTEQYIKICSGLSLQHTAQTLMHEIDHLIWAFGDLQDGDPEEKIVTVMSYIRAQVYRDNPQLLSYLAAVFGAPHVRP